MVYDPNRATDEYFKQVQSSFMTGAASNPEAAAGQPLIKPQNKLAQYIKFKPGVSPDVSAPKSKIKSPMSRNEKNLRRRQGRD